MNRQKSYFVLFITIASVLMADSSGPEMELIINGHEHLVPDIVSRAVVDAYLANKSAMEEMMSDTTLSDGTYIENVEFKGWVSEITFEQGAAPEETIITVAIKKNTARVKVYKKIPQTRWDPINGWYVVFKEAPIWLDVKFDLEITLNGGITSSEDGIVFSILTSSAEGKNIKSSSGNLVKDLIINFLISVIDLSGFSTELSSFVGQEYVLLGPSSFGQILGANLVDGANTEEEYELLRRAVPVEINLLYEEEIYTGLFGIPIARYKGVTVDIDFLHGYYDQYGTLHMVYEDIDPGIPAASQLQFTGFSPVYGGLQGAYRWETGLSAIKRAGKVFSKISSDTLVHCRIEAKWNQIDPEIPFDDVTGLPSPDDPQTIINYTNEIDEEGGWAELDAIMDSVQFYGIQPYVAIGVGHKDRTPSFNGKPICPGTPRGTDGASYHSVSGQVYRYWLEIYARAVVERYKDRIDVWQVENELNAARQAEVFDVFRMGSSWSNESFQNQVIQTLYNAVKDQTNDQGSVVHDFHIFNMSKRINDWKNYYDIVGVNFYPNDITAEPVLGFMIGEAVWAARRILKHLGTAHENKPVWVTETAYPSYNASDPLYSQDNQEKYLAEAFNSSEDMGAQGFHWFELTSTELNDPDNVNNYSGLVSSTGEKPAYSTYENTDKILRQGTAVTLANKYQSELLGGYLSVKDVYNSIPSGNSLNLSQNGTYTIKTNEQLLSKTDSTDIVTHHHWNTDESQHRLDHDVDVAIAGENDEAKFKYTDLVSFSTNFMDTIDLTEDIEIRDPWHMDATGDQPNEFFSLYETTDTTFYYAFLNQGDIYNLVPPYYSLRAPWVGQLSDSEYVAFYDWNANGAQLGTDPDYPSSPNTKAVVFQTPNASIEAIYAEVTVRGGTLFHKYGDFHVQAPHYLATTDSIYQFDYWEANGANLNNPEAGHTILEFTSDRAVLTAEYKAILPSQTASSFDLNSDLRIPAGAHYRFTPGFQWNIIAEPVTLTFAGTADNPIILECHADYLGKASDISWAGLRVIRGSLDMQHTVILEADTAVLAEQHPVDDIDIRIYNCTFAGNGVGVWMEEQDGYWGHISADVRNNIFSQQNVGMTLLIQHLTNSYTLRYNWFNECNQNGLTYCYLDNVNCSNNNETAPDPLFSDPLNGDYHLTMNSPYINSGDQDTPQDPDGTRADIGAYHFPHYQGSISSDLTWSGQINILDNVTVDSGATLTMLPGTELLIQPSKKIIVYGAIEAQGTNTDRIIFTRSDPTSSDKRFWQGIKAYSPGTFNLDYVNVYGAINGLYASYGMGAISNCIFEDDYLGIYLYHSDGIPIRDSEFIDNTRQGVLYNYSEADISYCQFRDNKWAVFMTRSSGDISHSKMEQSSYDGLFLMNSSSADLSMKRSDDGTQPDVNNVIANNDRYGVYVSYNSSPDLGTYSWRPGKYYTGGFNQFDRGSGSYDVYNASSITVPAEVNWWSSMNNYGPLDANPTADDLFGPPSKSIATSDEEPDSLELLLEQAYTMEADSLFAEAIQLLNDIITAAPDDPIVYAALNGIVSIFKRINNESGLLANLNALHEMYPDRLAGISAYDYSVTAYANMQNFDEALSRSEDVIAIYISQGAEEEPAWSILEQGFIYEYIAQSENSMDRVTSVGQLRAKAEQAFGHVLHDYSQTEAAWFLRQLLGEDYAGGVSLIPQEFSLAPAFPNPFNPVTTLIYNLPEESRVELTIYNLLGREVIRLVDENKPSGRYSEIWNGRDKFGTQVASGMYFCRLSAKSLEGRWEFHKSRKMVLLR